MVDNPELAKEIEGKIREKIKECKTHNLEPDNGLVSAPFRFCRNGFLFPDFEMR